METNKERKGYLMGAPFKAVNIPDADLAGLPGSIYERGLAEVALEYNTTIYLLKKHMAKMGTPFRDLHRTLTPLRERICEVIAQHPGINQVGISRELNKNYGNVAACNMGLLIHGKIFRGTVSMDARHWEYSAGKQRGGWYLNNDAGKEAEAVNAQRLKDYLERKEQERTDRF